MSRQLLPVEITVDFRKHARDDQGYVVHRSRLGVGETQSIDGIPVTSPERTILDLATMLPGDDLELAFDAGRRKRIIEPAGVLSMTEPLLSTGRRGVRMLHDIAKQRLGTPETDSAMETRFLQVFSRGGLPAPKVHHLIRRGPVVLAEADFAWTEQRLVVEVNGFAAHGTRRAFTRDHNRKHVIEDAGYLVKEFTWDDLARERYVCSVVRKILFERGHPDVVSV